MSLNKLDYEDAKTYFEEAIILLVNLNVDAKLCLLKAKVYRQYFLYFHFLFNIPYNTSRSYGITELRLGNFDESFIKLQKALE